MQYHMLNFTYLSKFILDLRLVSQLYEHGNNCYFSTIHLISNFSFCANLITYMRTKLFVLAYVRAKLISPRILSYPPKRGVPALYYKFSPLTEDPIHGSRIRRAKLSSQLNTF